MTRNNLYNEDRRRWRAITFDYDVIVAQEDLSGTFHCLSATTRMLIMSMLPYLSWSTRYDGEDMDTDKIQLWFETATDELGGDMIRQNPANPCQMQMSCDGVSWTTVMDYSYCVGEVPTEIVEAGSDLLSDNMTTYDDDISNVTNFWDYDQTYPDADTDTALCWSIGQYVDFVLDAQVDQINKANEESNYLQDFAVFTGLAAGVAGVLAAVGIFVATAATGGAVLGLLTIILAMSGDWDDSDPAEFMDEDIREDIRCDMYLAMVGEKPTFANWSTALSVSGSNDPNDYVLDTLQSEDLFMQWLVNTGGMVEMVTEAGIDNECTECGEYPVLGDWTATASLKGASLPEFCSIPVGNNGIHTEDYGIQFECNTEGTDNRRAYIRCDSPVPVNLNDGNHVRYESLSLGQTDSGQVQAAIAILNPDYESLKTWNFGQVFTGDGVLNTDASRQTVDMVQTFCRSSIYSCGGDGYLTEIQLRGNGVCPFDGASGWVVVEL